MKKEEKIDFSQEPITLELGRKFESKIKKNKTYFYSSIEDICNSINGSEGITVPKIHVTYNYELKSTGYRLNIYGKIIEDSIIYTSHVGENNVLIFLIHYLKNLLKNNSFYFKNDLKISKEKIEELKLEQSREAYQQLYRYYSNIELDKKQAFHWLKKMSYYRVPGDLRKLSECYFYGDGCDKDERQNRKLFDLWHSDSSSKGRF